MLSGSRAIVALVIGLVIGAGVCLGVGQLLASDHPGAHRPMRPAATGEPAAAAPRESVGVAVLRAWDARRAAAWARGDPVALRGLYVPGSSAGAADVRLLRRWTARGLEVHDLGEQVLAARVVELGPRRIRIVVSERLTGGSAGPPGGTRIRLPTGGVRTREVVLRRAAAGEPRGSAVDWLVARVASASRGHARGER